MNIPIDQSMASAIARPVSAGSAGYPAYYSSGAESLIPDQPNWQGLAYALQYIE